MDDQSRKQDMSSDKPNWFHAQVWRIHILLANWKAEAKGKLGISNQDYPGIREQAVKDLLYDAIRLRAAEEVIYKSLDSSLAICNQYDEKITEYLKEITGSPAGAGFPRPPFPGPSGSSSEEGKGG